MFCPTPLLFGWGLIILLLPRKSRMTAVIKWREGSFFMWQWVGVLLTNPSSIRARWCSGFSTTNPPSGRRVQAHSQVRKEHHAVGVLLSFALSVSFLIGSWKCRVTTSWLASWTWPQIQNIPDRFWCLWAVSSLVKTGTVDDLRELSKWVHHVHRFRSLRCSLFWLLSLVKSSFKVLIQWTYSGEELSQCRNAPVLPPQLLPVVSQTDQSSVSDRSVDAVAVC